MYPGEEEEEHEVFWWEDLAEAKRCVIVSCSLSLQPHHVSVLGQKLLALTDGEGFRHIVKEFKLRHYTMFFLLIWTKSLKVLIKVTSQKKRTPKSKITQKYTQKHVENKNTNKQNYLHKIQNYETTSFSKI